MDRRFLVGLEGGEREVPFGDDAHTSVLVPTPSVPPVSSIKFRRRSLSPSSTPRPHSLIILVPARVMTPFGKTLVGQEIKSLKNFHQFEKKKKKNHVFRIYLGIDFISTRLASFSSSILNLLPTNLVLNLCG